MGMSYRYPRWSIGTLRRLAEKLEKAGWEAVDVRILRDIADEKEKDENVLDEMRKRFGIDVRHYEK